MQNQIYDFAIVGSGAAGLHLALAMANDPWFDNKKILILDKDDKNLNDRTWCFWEINNGLWDSIISKQWTFGDFYYKNEHLLLELEPYRYKLLRSIDFYEFAKSVIRKKSNFFWIVDEIVNIAEKDSIELLGMSNKYAANQVFDSRIDPEYNFDKKHIKILQHFKGWFIRVEEDIFDDARFTMMDYRIQYKNSTSFTYLLPMSKRTALVEFTLFTPELIQKNEYDELLKEYLNKILKIETYTIEHKEFGVIPMTSFPFQKTSTQRIHKIGTAGGWVKASSGYSFKNAEKNAVLTVKNIKSGSNLNKGIQSKRAGFMDDIFLKVLHDRNELGPSIFHDMYSKNSIQQIFAFLDEETSLWQDLNIISSFKVLPFINAMIKNLVKF